MDCQSASEKIPSSLPVFKRFSARVNAAKIIVMFPKSIKYKTGLVDPNSEFPSIRSLRTMTAIARVIRNLIKLTYESTYQCYRKGLGWVLSECICFYSRQCRCGNTRKNQHLKCRSGAEGSYNESVRYEERCHPKSVHKYTVH